MNHSSEKKTIPYITIAEIEKYSVLLPGPNFRKQITDFEKVYQSWSDKFEILREANDTLVKFNNELLKEIKIETITSK